MRNLLMIAASAAMLSGCMTVAKGTAKAVTLPVKGAYHGTKMVGKGVYGTTKFAGKSVYNTGKAVYYVGRVPVVITDKALDTTSKVLVVTTQAVDLTGKVVVTSHKISSVKLDSELDKIRAAKNIISVMVDVA